jgi:tRNA dimethylallyltransferase
VDSVVYDYEFGGTVDEKVRTNLNEMTVTELQNYCNKHNISLPENYKNKRYLIRAIECQNVVKNNHQKIRNDVIMIGLMIDKDKLKKRIEARAKQMFRDELYDETRRLAENYSFDLESMKSNVYLIAWQLINNEISYDDALLLSKTDDWHLAKKQMTWFRRNSAIKWLSSDKIEDYLNKKFARN